MIKKIYNSVALKLVFIIAFLFMIVVNIASHYNSIRANNELFEAYMDQRELTQQQTKFINELLDVIRKYTESKSE